MVNREQGEFQPVRHADLVIDVAQVVLDHLFGGFQLKCNFLVALALHNASDDHRLFGRESRLWARS